MSELTLGLFTGMGFGILLQQGRVLRFENQVGAMLLKDMTILKFMLSAIIVGGIGIHTLVGLDLVSFSVKATSIGANLIGGILFGMGWAVMGYCPGTSVGALGEGRWHAIWAVLGMLSGAALYAETYPLLKSNVLSWGKLGKITLPSITGISSSVVMAFFVMLLIAVMVMFEKKEI